MLGRLCWYLEQTKEAIVQFKNAYQILSLTHGSDSVLVRELMRLFEEAQAEFRHKPIK